MSRKRIHSLPDEAGELRRRKVVEALRPRTRAIYESLRQQGLDQGTAMMRAFGRAVAEQRQEVR